MFILVSYSENGYSIHDQSEDFERLQQIKNNPAPLTFDALVLQGLEDDEVCGSTSFGQPNQFDDEYQEPVEFFILHEDFIPASEDKSFLETLLDLYPYPSMLAEALENEHAWVA